MKKFRIVLLSVSVLTLLVSASVWEGSALVSSGGDLPEIGYYAATNSFPRNTVVDITNLENGKRVRVVVAKGLDSPGLVAVLSPGAAAVIGILPNALGRVRLDQIAEPLGSSFFGGTAYPAGDPDHDPAARLAAEGGLDPALLEEKGVRDEAAAAALVPAVPAAIAAPAASAPLAAVPPSAVPTTAAVSETAPAAAAPPASAPLAAVPPSSGAETAPAETPEVSPPAAPPSAVETARGTAPAAAALPASAPLAAVPPSSGAETAPEETLELSPPAAVIAAPLPAVEVPAPGAPDTFELSPPEYDAAGAEASAVPGPETAVPEHIANAEAYDYILEPSEPKIPVTPDPFIDPVDMSAPPSRSAGTYEIDPAYVIPPVSGLPSAVSESAVPPAPPSAFAAPLPETASPVPAAAGFSVPVISGLEKGRYYIQVAALGRAEAVESEIKKIGGSLPMAVQPINNTEEKTVYRLLIGPVNLGESGALLQRFKTSYKDAFVRLGT